MSVRSRRRRESAESFDPPRDVRAAGGNVFKAAAERNAHSQRLAIDRVRSLLAEREAMRQQPERAAVPALSPDVPEREKPPERVQPVQRLDNLRDNCKQRPKGSRGGGGGRPFVPWCR